jgi:hypothetical protein
MKSIKYFRNIALHMVGMSGRPKFEASGRPSQENMVFQWTLETNGS